MSRELKVLLLEDSPLDAELISRELRRSLPDAQTLLVDGKEAFASALGTFSPDLVLSDNSLPSFSGLDALSLTRQTCPDAGFVVVSGTVGEERAVEMLRAGVTDYVLKDHLSRLGPAVTRALLEVEQRRSTRLVEQQAREANERFRITSEHAPVGIFQTDAQDQYVYVNPRWTEILGISQEEALGRRWATLGDDRRPIGPVVAGGGDGREMTHRFELRTPGLPLRTVVVTSRHIYDADGQVSGRVGTLSDITVEAAAEAALREARDRANELSRLKSDFLANMSHEIRTPMIGVIGMTDLLLGSGLDDRQSDYARILKESGSSLMVLINEILDFSRGEAGKLEIERVDCDLRGVVNGVVDLMGGAARSKGLALVAVLDPSVPPLVRTDPTRVRQVLTNLVGNAIKFTAAGEVLVRLGRGAAGELALAVSDTGEGIAPEQLSRIFQPFVQADTSTSRRYGGTGLGLAISRQLVGLLGGKLDAVSTLGVGSTFSFTVAVSTGVTGPAPVVEPGAAARTAPLPGPAPVVAGTTGAQEPALGTVLLAEDNLINQKVAVAMLAGSGYRVDTVLNGAKALDAVIAHSYDAILMDCQMPVMNGYEATAAIRAYEAGRRHTQIIALTAGARPEDRERCLAEGMDDYLAKPVSKSELINRIRQAVSRRTPGSS